MITIACLKWNRQATGHVLPHVCDYTAEHVNVFARMVRRHTTVPHRVVCITDDPTGITECDTLPLWPMYSAGGCYHRLRMFSRDMADMLGPRFMWMDMDCVITGSIDHIVGCDHDFAMHEYAYPDRPMQFYNGSLCIMNAGCRELVWSKFDPVLSPKAMIRMNDRKLLVGSDQAWISHMLGYGEATFGPEHGVYEALRIRGKLPDNAAIVFFSGPRDPSKGEYSWVKEHWR